MKLKIDNESIAQEFFEDAVLLGIVAPIKDYLFSWHLNQIFGFNFRVNNDIEIVLTKQQRKYFFQFTNMLFHLPLLPTTYTITSLMVNTCYRNLNTLILYGSSRGSTFLQKN